MKSFRMIMTGIMSATLLTGLSISALSSDTMNLTNNAVELESNIFSNTENRASYGSVSGTVTEILNYVDVEGKEVEGMKYVLTENDSGDQTRFLVTGETYFATDNELKVGAKITGFYDALAPVLMIYPPQYNAVVIAVDLLETQSIKVAKFDDDLISDDFELKLNISDETKIISHDGEAFEGDIKNRTLAVTYSFTTRSIPAQTSPLKVVVLPEKPPITTPELTEDEVAALPNSSEFITLSSVKEIIVNGTQISAPTPYLNDRGVLMVPLRAIAEALGYNVSWDSVERSILLDNSISLSIGKDYYTYLRTAPIQLGTAPEILSGNTYVPLAFFREVARMNNAYEFEGQIVINNEETLN